MKRRMVMVGLLVWCSLVAALAMQPTRSVYEASDGTLYAVSTGTVLGSCGPVAGGYQCVDGDNIITVLDGLGCQQKDGLASCTVVGDEPIYPAGTNTLECDERNYELSDGGTGSCSGNNGESMTCAQPETNNYASASCESGCGEVNGTGSCTVKAKPE